MTQAMAAPKTLDATDNGSEKLAQLKSVADDLERSLAEERAMAITLFDTISRLDEHGEALRRAAKG